MYEVDENGVCTITMSRPEAMNAMDDGIMLGTCAAIAKAADDQSAKVVILTGAGKGFCAGGDVKGMAESRTGSAPVKPMPMEGAIWQLRANAYSSELLRNMGKVTIAAVNGACAGAGLSWACACDMRYSTASAKFTTAFLNVGLSGDLGAAWLLPRIVGAAKARELLYTADVFNGESAKRMGLVTEAYPDRDTLMAEVRRVAAAIAKRPPTALRRMKANLIDADRMPFSEFLGQETERHVRSGASPDAGIAVRAFVTRTEPDYSGVRKRAPHELSRL